MIKKYINNQDITVEQKEREETVTKKKILEALKNTQHGEIIHREIQISKLGRWPSNYTPEIPGSAFIIGGSANPGSLGVDQGAAGLKSRIGNRAIDAAANALSDNSLQPSRTVTLLLFTDKEREGILSNVRITLISLFLAGKLVARLADADEELTALQSMKMAFS